MNKLSYNTYDLKTHYDIYIYFFLELPKNSFASSWSLSMEQCRKSQPSTYLLGDINMSNPDMVCSHIQRQLQLVWLGVVRQIYTSIDQGIYLILSLTQLVEWHNSFIKPNLLFVHIQIRLKYLFSSDI